MPIPIIVGVTGHRDLREKDVPRLRELVCAELQTLIADYRHSPLIMLNSLASGADLLCAEVAIELGVVLKCPLPMPEEVYCRDFEGEDLIRYKAVLGQAEEVFIAPGTEPAPVELNRDDCYRQAGIYVAAHSHVLLALWDGSPAKPGGCGTAETVDFMLKGRYESGRCFKAVNDGAVIHITTPRQNSGSELTISARRIENEPGSLRDILYMTDAFNRDAATQPDETDNTTELLPGKYLDNNATLKRLSALYHKADALSLRFQKRYLSAMGCFSIFGVLLVLFFLLYDELEANIFLLCYGLFIIVYFLAFMFTQKSKAHMKYLQYRALSEALRVQFYLSATGLTMNIGDSFTWTQKQDSTWVKKAVSALLTGAPDTPDIPDELIKSYWIDGQLAYHKKALARDLGKHRFNEKSARWMLICSVGLFAAVLILELFCSFAITQPLFAVRFPEFFMQHGELVLTLRSLMKIVLGGISAMAVFLTNYYGKLSLERKSIDHQKMVRLYSAAKDIYENGEVCLDMLFTELAREEIIENGNWFSYCRENSPSFNV